MSLYLIQIDSPDKWQQFPLQNRKTVQRDLIGSYFNSSIQSLMLILFDKVLMKFYSLVCAWNVISFVEENDRNIYHGNKFFSQKHKAVNELVTKPRHDFLLRKIP